MVIAIRPLREQKKEKKVPIVESGASRGLTLAICRPPAKARVRTKFQWSDRRGAGEPVTVPLVRSPLPKGRSAQCNNLMGLSVVRRVPVDR